MNNLLQLKGTFEQKSRDFGMGPSNLPSGQTLKVVHLEKLKKDLDRLYSFWKDNQLLEDTLISVYYDNVIAKSRRISATFAGGGKNINDTIVGAKFSNNGKKHIITHYIRKDILVATIKKYEIIIAVIKKHYDNKISYGDIDTINKEKLNLSNEISRSSFVQIVVDAYYVEKFDIEDHAESFDGESIISIYDTGMDTKKLLEDIGINIFSERLLDKTTVLLTPDQYNILKDKAPYPISMGVSDFSLLTKSDFDSQLLENIITIPAPTNESTIGVIDTLFDERVYFSEWVDYKMMVDSDIDLSDDDYFHGTAVSSIIVDGVSSNPHLDDGCGRFKVRHFGVSTADGFSSFSVLRAINEIIKNNRDIKVWNLCLGSVRAIHPHFISPEGAFLDKIQYENDVIFVIAGTNKKRDDPDGMAIGSPADSINSLVVNAVNDRNMPASYSRRGPVLSFFTKPDVACFGGDGMNKIKVCTPTGEAFVCGTSFAAPWVARKLSYLINILGLSREIAKALILHSAIGWDVKLEETSFLIGYGIVPQHIDDIIKSPDDEIRFILSGVSEKHDTYTYSLPVPVYNEKHPFIAKATMCYFPSCSRNQGVDYTNTEFDLSFGRIDENGKIRPINKKLESATADSRYEGNARRLFRKWDNVKHLLEFDKESNKPRKAYSKKLWGISIKTLERLGGKDGVGLKFGLIVTLKHLSGENKIQDFIQQCQLKGWLVNRIDIDNRIDIHNTAEELVKFDEN